MNQAQKEKVAEQEQPNQIVCENCGRKLKSENMFIPSNESRNSEMLHLMYVELPNMIHRIMQLAFLELEGNEKSIEVVADETKKISSNEVSASLDKFRL